VQTKRDVLRDSRWLAPLLDAAAGCDRLVLLGDLLELRHGPVRDAMSVAQAPLRALGAALGPAREVIILAGNHDYDLIAPWLGRRGRDAPAPPLGLETPVEPNAGDDLATIAEWLAPASVRAAYPGVWLREDVYATHGHYADLHLTIPTIERLAAGVMARIVGLADTGPACAEDYEAALAPLYAWIHAMAQRIDPARGGTLHGGSVRGWRALTGPGRRGVRRRSVALAFPVVVAALNRAGLGPLRAELSGAALRRAGLRGIEEASARLGVRADHVVFGHTHRAGPLPGDDPGEWTTAAGARLTNSGCWVQEPAFTAADPGRSPYRVGFAVWVGESGAPELVNLLDR
jgi:hypothetical protein